jgi:hypothetical protein
MKFKKFLDQIDTSGLVCNIYFAEDDTEPIYCGSMWDIPYWLTDFQIAKYNSEENKDKPIWFANNIRKNANDERGTEGYNGFIITLTEQKEN